MKFLLNRLHYLISVALATTLIVSGNIRRHKEKFYMAFDRVQENVQMIQAHVIASFSRLALRDCVIKCMLAPFCEAINFNQSSGGCQTLNSSTLVTRNLLIRNPGWIFYETDPAKKDNGHYCEALSPCPDTHICDDTYEQSPLYTCRCEENFAGKDCGVYIGPGVNESLPAGSCGLLKLKHRKLMNGFYWLKASSGKAEQKFCEISEGAAGLSATSAVPSCDWLIQNYPRYPTRHYYVFDEIKRIVSRTLCNMIWDVVDGQWSKWSSYTKCSEPCGDGIKRRTRKCDSPKPATPFGASCREDKQTEETNETQCNERKCEGCDILPDKVLVASSKYQNKDEISQWMSCFLSCKYSNMNGFVWDSMKVKCTCVDGDLRVRSKVDHISGFIDNGCKLASLIHNDAEAGRIECMFGDTVDVTWASYGPEKIFHSCALVKTDLVKSWCKGKSICKIFVTKRFLNKNGVDNCGNETKYLFVQYRCTM